MGRVAVEQLCLLMNEDSRRHERIVTQCFASEFERDAQARNEFLRAIDFGWARFVFIATGRSKVDKALRSCRGEILFWKWGRANRLVVSSITSRCSITRFTDTVPLAIYHLLSLSGLMR